MNSPRTRWGGIRNGHFQPSGYFRTGEQDGVSWLVDPDGGRFLSKGVNTVRFDQDRIQETERIPYADACRKKYGSLSGWRTAAADRLWDLGFNTLGAWSDEAAATAGSAQLALTPNLDLGISFTWLRNSHYQQHFPDVFDPAFERHVQKQAQRLCGARSTNQNIIGWFIDTELRWGPDWRGADDLLTLFLNLPPAVPGRQATVKWIRKRYLNFDLFKQTWRTASLSWDEFEKLERIQAPFLRKPPYQRIASEELVANRADTARAAFVADCEAFEALVAERYFALTTAAIRTYDPNHLVLGSRFAYAPPAPIIKAAGRNVDVISFNCYGLDPRTDIEAYSIAARPCLIGEFSFRAADSGLPNTNGAGTVVATQAERAACYTHYASSALTNPHVIGLHWFEHADQPAEGRFDGENSNYGIVTIDDRLYQELAESMRTLNGSIEGLHAAEHVAPLQVT